MSYNFYVVATPIGNLSDISMRAVEVLKSVDYIACEDTRVTRILADKYSIKAKLFDCHKFNEKEKSCQILDLLKDDKKVALVSDAGTPCISDPGNTLIKTLYENGVKITSVPGACAVTTFLSLVPRDSEEYAFIGFIPRVKKQQYDILDKYRYTNCVFYESPNRLMDTLLNIQEFFGEDKKIAVARELTKVFEEVKIDEVKNIIKYYRENTLKGEIVALVFAQDKKEDSNEFIMEKINILKEEGYSPKDISKIISKLYNINKNKVYKMVIG